MTHIPIPVHIGSEPPTHWNDVEERQQRYKEEASQHLLDMRRPALARPDLDWKSLGFEPRWVGFDAADCVAALQPSIFSGQGADEFNRFRQGAQSRGEVAVVISTIGKVDNGDRAVRNIFATADDSIHLGRFGSTVSAKSLGKGSRARAANDLSDSDTQLALRLLSCNPPLPWRALSLHGVTYESHKGREHHPAQGTFEPIVVTELGEPVVAAWVSPDGVERRYVVPIETPWPVVLKWLLEYGLPEYVPGAMRRARHQLAADDSLMTRRERSVRAAIAELERDHAARHADLARELESAKATATAVREGLLYGTGTPLVDTVRSVLEFAGIAVIDLDTQLGGTKNADLLCSHDGRSRLVEVKSASGSVSERAYEDLMRHLREWKQLPGSAQIDGGALVINHEHRKLPGERADKPYGRPEFLAAQTEPIITTLDLFDAWREDDAGAVRRLLFGAVEEQLEVGAEIPSTATVFAGRKRGWLRRR